MSDVNTLRRQKYAEKLLVTKALKEGNVELMATALQTATGKKMLAPLMRNIDDRFEQLAANARDLLKDSGKVTQTGGRPPAGGWTPG